MSATNQVTVVGNLTRDPELSFTASGTALAKLSVAHNHRWFNKTANDWEEKVSFFDCVIWGALAENAAESLTKGLRVIVTGRLDLQQWENKDGEKRSKVEIVVDTIGPDLTFATADVSRVESNQGGGGSRQGGSGGRTTARRKPREEPAQHEYTDDEEPF
jgi:single-strand DNA-binding protein